MYPGLLAPLSALDVALGLLRYLSFCHNLGTYISTYDHLLPSLLPRKVSSVEISVLSSLLCLDWANELLFY